VAETKAVRPPFFPGIHCSTEHLDRFDNPLVKAMIDRISKQAPSYYLAIQKSSNTAQAECAFVQDAIDCCKRLYRAEDSVDTLKMGFDDMKETAK
jgi:prephenate dehydrogenase